MKVRHAINDWLTECECRNYSPKTIKGYKTNLNIFATYLEEEQNIVQVDDINMAVIKQFTQYMIKGRKATYVNSLLKSAKSFIQYMYEEYGEGFNTHGKKFRWLKEEKPLIKTFRPKHIKYILDECRGVDFLSIRDFTIVTTFIETGIRCNELIQIKPQDIFDDYILINGKGNKRRIVPITPHLKKALMRYDRVRESYFQFKGTDENYFLSYTGKVLTNSGIEHMLKRRCKGLEDAIGIRCSPHDFRHFFAQTSLKQGRDIYSISRQLGHESLSITAIYLRSLQDEDMIKLAKENSILRNMR